ncbi:ABC transporter substrate-binding protein [Paenibacillus sp. UNC451MF]|uniref:ABC transporter substrate-binding protein n=1 Tax=Paenibacillus sp. UNC451MF TaxID=1449063 RepID=UPI00048CB2EC|nr:extracellular solute-binding protein [Paenibacillus sp. UNC451MF]
MNIPNSERTVTEFRRKKYGFSLLALAAGLVLLLNGCDQSGSAAAPQPKGSLRIAMSSEDYFQYEYADYFTAKFPELDVQVVSTQDLYGPGKNYMKEYIKLIDEQKPDLLITSTFEYDKLIQAGKLYDLSPLITKDQFDLHNLLPAAVDYLQLKGQGKLYGLAPSFSSSVLFYNKDVFDKLHIAYPKDQMTWEELIRLAQRFQGEGSKDERIYGFHMGFMKSPLDLVSYIGQAEGLAFIDPAGKNLMMNTDAWKRIYGLVIDGYKSGVLQWTYTPDKRRYDKEDVEREDMFGAGRAAMTIGHIGQINSLKQRGASFAWDMVGAPSSNPGRSSNPNFYILPIYSINAQAENVSSAWEVVKYFNGREAAKIASKTSMELPVRKEFAKEIDGHSLEPFYNVKYNENVQSGYNENIPLSFTEQLQVIMEKQMEAMLQSGVSVEAGLQQIQEQGQQALDKAYAEERVKSGAD